MNRLYFLILTLLLIHFEKARAFRPASSCLRVFSASGVVKLTRDRSVAIPNIANNSKRASCNGPLFMKNNDPDEELSIVGVAGLAAQPIVWISLYFVATTGAGLPAGPFGLLGGLEGVAYLAVVGLVASSIWKKLNGVSDDTSAAEKLSLLTLAIALLTLLSLVIHQGCVPNAKPILDYSDYLPVCNPEDTPGIFGL